LGTGRCGSTLVHRLLALHPDAGWVSTVDDRFGLPPAAGRCNGVLYRRLARRQPGLPRRFGPSEGYRLLERSVAPVLVDPCRDLVADDLTPWTEARLRRFVEQRARAQGTQVFVLKMTGWPRARMLAAALPEARFVEIVRDGRAVASSLLQMPWFRAQRGPSATSIGLPPTATDDWEKAGRSFVALAGLTWSSLLDAYDESRSALPSDGWLRIRYEDLVADPVEVMGQILDFAGLRPHSDVDDGLAERTSAGRLDAYLRDLHPAQVKELESIEQAQL
jgi:hypothetical protein